MRLAVTTVIRRVPPGMRSGRLLVVDVDDGHRLTVAADLRLPENRFRPVDPNPRGGTRGLRAVAPLDDGMVVTDYCTVYRLDADGGILDRIEHPWASGNHAVRPDRTGFWLAATNADAVLRIDWSGRLVDVWRPTGQPSLAPLDLVPPDVPEEIGDYRDPLSLSRHVHDTTHVNSVWVADAGLTVSLGFVLTRVTGDGGAAAARETDVESFRHRSWQAPAGEWTSSHAIVHQPLDGQGHPCGDPGIRWHAPSEPNPSHDIHLSAGDLWFNDSNASEMVCVRGGTAVRRIPVAGSFLRGLAPLTDDQVIVATQQPLRLHRVDLAAGRVVATMPVPGHPDESITAVAVLS